MNVLSLFDGMSCGMLALEREGITPDNYFASEVDKYAMKVSAANYPEIQQIGDVTKIDYSSLPKIDLLMGGSPCQGFSFAGKQLNFDDPRSALFFEFVKAKDKLNPKYFLLENVRMKKEYQDIISNLLGVEPILINSALVSAQNRQRLYWTNIPGVTQPDDRKIFLADILEDESDNFVLMSDKFVSRQKGRNCLVTDLNVKAKNLSALEYVKNGRQGDYIKCGSMTSIQKDNLLIYLNGMNSRVKGISINKDGIRPYKEDDRKSGISEMGRLLFREAEKTPTLTSTHVPKLLDYPMSLFIIFNKLKPHYRKLTPVECERLQTVPDNYTNHVSNTQRYKMLGNSWTIEAIAHILKNINTLELKTVFKRLNK